MLCNGNLLWYDYTEEQVFRLLQEKRCQRDPNESGVKKTGNQFQIQDPLPKIENVSLAGFQLEQEERH